VTAWVAVGLAGALGAVARAWVVGVWGPARGTLVVNLVGALLLGVLHGSALPSLWVTAVGVGFLGAFTTYASWMLQAAEAWRAGACRRVQWTTPLTLLAGVAAYAAARLWLAALT
jgi:CrcB protein